ncbi:MAG: hypothetical protein QGI89_03690 [Candidatus Woesearchaeota archaeon]|jgi:hypothetical protein|nr:hypothetical protein [Candidatus Woesearchaeota archaeon]
MLKIDSNYYGRILIVLLVTTLAALQFSEPSITGFAVKETQFSEFDVELYGNEQHVCADGSFYQECSSLIKGKFCHLGKLVDYCDLCGCDPGEVCENRECVAE